MEITQKNVGSIAERIVRNELEYRGFRTVDLNNARDVSDNADILAARAGVYWQIQVKAMTQIKNNENWCFQYGFCNENIIKKEESVFNRKGGYYRANVVILLSVRSPSNYKSIIIPTKKAEEAAQVNLDGYYRLPARDGAERKPHKMWIILEKRPREKINEFTNKQRDILLPYVDDWEKAFAEENL